MAAGPGGAGAVTTIPNFAKVDDRVWRGARPTAEQAAWLVGQGVCSVINLEWEQSDDAAFAAWPDVRLFRIKDFEPLPWFARSIEDRHVLRALAAIREATPITYVHCRSGQNRTGVIVAAYRLLMRADPLDSVLADFKSYRGAWAWGDAIYIRSLRRRRVEFDGR